MIGSQRRIKALMAQLEDEGFSSEQLGKIHAPIGLDIGAETPEEIAVSVMAEITKSRRGGTGRSLSDRRRGVWQP
jgi:xanthine dehydrogenase accessory factor